MQTEIVSTHQKSEYRCSDISHSHICIQEMCVAPIKLREFLDQGNRRCRFRNDGSGSIFLTEATSNDVIITQLTKRLNKYAHPGTIKSATSRVVETTLSGISVIGPCFAIPLAAAGALEVYLQGTGGSEQKKLEKELAMAQRIRSRVAVLTRETAMGLENYRLAQVTNNAPLQYFSQGLLCSMTSSKFVSAKLMTPEIVPDESIVPAIVETFEKDKLQ